MNTIERLTEYFRKFPGIGPRQAKRFVYFLLSQDQRYIDEFVREIQKLKSSTLQCPECYIYFTKDNYSSLCDICSRGDTDISSLMIVSKDVDVEAIKKADIYNGRYFVLGGTLPFLEKDVSKYIRDQELYKYISKHKSEITEIIFALPVTPEGENTEKYLEENINLDSKIFKTLGRGLSTGTEIEYSDTSTIKNAFKNRF